MEKVSPVPTDARWSLYEATLPELEAAMQQWGEPSFRARQLYRHLYSRLTSDIQAMTDLPGSLRARLLEETQAGGLRVVRERRTDDGQTRKALMALPDGVMIETVLMVYPERATVCVSTQAGCGIGCVFCATGQAGLRRNLSSGEIVEQVVWAARQVRAISLERSSHLNVVFMGMGEPFANYERWWDAVKRLHDPQGFNLSARKMTVSTVGLVPGIRRLSQESLPINLAISLHAPDDALRDTLIPINRRYPLAAVLEAARDYTERTGRRVSLEYVLLQGRNDHPDQARALAQRLRSLAVAGHALLFHVNLIPWNPVPGSALSRPERQRVLRFQQVLQEHQIACTVRVERGGEIAAACGQLAGVPGNKSA
ncbi:MAG: 23S rRNA (adenine(2503)-C(2))-methyltransferase RlmN [Chloroflexaceae bacterium]|nr:23S rRNA (adenine(2503)-C(2))-methyltransferase RlmN [Chloroflexaceae bacterium]